MARVDAVKTLDSPRVLSLLRGRRLVNLTPAQILDLADIPGLESLVPKWLASEQLEPQARSQAIHDVLVLGLATSAGKTLAALRATAKEPQFILPEHRRSLFERCLKLAERDVHPYERPGIPIEARLAAARLLEVNVDLDSTVLARLTTGSAVPDYLRVILTTALVGRVADRDELFVKLLQRWGPDEESALTLAEECDSKQSAADPVRSMSSRAAKFARIRDQLRRLARFAAPLAAGPTAFAAGLLGDHLVTDWPHNVRMGTTNALGTLGILVAVTVVSAELSAARLSGLIARWTSVPISLTAAYSASVVLICIASIQGHSQRLTAAATGSAPVVLTAFIVALGFVLAALVRRTDPANAARAFERARRAAYRGAGRRFGVAQRKALAFRDFAGTLPFVSLVPSITRVERRAEIPAANAGFLLPSQRRLARLGRSKRWNGETVRLEILSRVGTSVSAGERVAAIVPAPEATVTSRDLRRAARVFRVTQARRIQEATEASVLLLNVLATEAEQGNEQTVERVAESLVRLLEEHLRGVRAERLSTDQTLRFDQVLPVVPPVLAVTKRAARLIVHSEGSAVRAAVEQTLLRLLRVAQRGDDLPSLVVAALLYESTSASPGLATLFWEAGVSAIETGDRQGLFLVRSAISLRLRSSEGALTNDGVEAAARLAIYAVWNDQSAVDEVWRWYWEQTAGADSTRRIMGALRVGAASLLAWNPSTALRVSFALRAVVDLSKLEQHVRQPQVAMLEQTVADQFGHYLGADAEDALARFCQFATRVTPNGTSG